MKSIRLLFFIIGVTLTSNALSQNVYVTKSGKKFHKGSCYYLKSSKKEITFQRAIELNFQPCSVCKPSKKVDENEASTNSNSLTNDNQSKAVSKKSTSTQCTGKTKAGNRCKHMTTNSNGRCYQHQS